MGRCPHPEEGNRPDVVAEMGAIIRGSSFGGVDLLGYETDHTLLHTGYTGTFLVLDPIDKQGFIFFSNRVHTEDHNPEWIMECDKLIAAYQKERKHN